MKRKYRLNKKKFSEFLAGVVFAIIAEAIWLTFLLNI